MLARAFNVSLLVAKEEHLLPGTWAGGGGVESRGGRGAGKSSRAANCPPSYPPYTLSHTLTVTTLIPLPPWSPPPAGSSLILHTGSPSTLALPLLHPILHLPPRFLSTFPATASKALDYLPLISARVAHLLPRLSRLVRDRDHHLPRFPSSFSLSSLFFFYVFFFRFFSLFLFPPRPRNVRLFVRSFLRRSNHPSRLPSDPMAVRLFLPFLRHTNDSRYI